MMPIEVCVYCSRKVEEKEKSVNLPIGAAHLACAQKATNQRRRHRSDRLPVSVG
jgi:hypothetical protein